MGTLVGTIPRSRLMPRISWVQLPWRPNGDRLWECLTPPALLGCASRCTRCHTSSTSLATASPNTTSWARSAATRLSHQLARYCLPPRPSPRPHPLAHTATQRPTALVYSSRTEHSVNLSPTHFASTFTLPWTPLWTPHTIRPPVCCRSTRSASASGCPHKCVRRHVACLSNAGCGRRRCSARYGRRSTSPIPSSRSRALAATRSTCWRTRAIVRPPQAPALIDSLRMRPACEAELDRSIARQVRVPFQPHEHT
jgi:hypothetical protein